jgi:hypothetical protein
MRVFNWNCSLQLKKLGTWWDLSQKMVGFTRWGIKNTKLLDDWCSPALSQETWGYWYLVGGWAYPLKTDGLRQLGWWHSQLNGKVIKFMFQTTNQILLTNKQWLVDGFSWLILWVKTQPDFSLRISWEYGMEPRAIAAIPSCNQTWQWKSADFKMMFPLRAPFVGFHCYVADYQRVQCGPPNVINWFINPINYSYKYHKP